MAEGEGGLWISAEECRALFPRLKGQESLLPAPERGLLRRIEGLLYQELSVEEMETLQRLVSGGGIPENSRAV